MGPIAVRATEPGRALAVQPAAPTPDSWGFTAANSQGTPLNRRLGVIGLPPEESPASEGATETEDHEEPTAEPRVTLG